MLYNASEDKFPLPDRIRAFYGPFGFPEPPAARPYITSNFVMGLDGRASSRYRDTPAAINFCSSEDRWLMQFLRAHHDAILMGANTMREEPGEVSAEKSTASGAFRGKSLQSAQGFRGRRRADHGVAACHRARRRPPDYRAAGRRGRAGRHRERRLIDALFKRKPGHAGGGPGFRSVLHSGRTRERYKNLRSTSSCDRILGIDVGNTGAIAVLNRDGELVAVHDMPTLRDGPKSRPTINAPLLAAIIANSHASKAFVEFIGPRPGEGAVGAFAFGRAKGLVEGVCASAGVSITWLTAPTWKRLVGIPPGRDQKDAARSAAIGKWVQMAGFFCLRRDDGRAEAALIGLAGIMRERAK